MLKVSVMYVDAAGAVFDVALTLPDAATVGDAVLQSGFLAAHPDQRLDALALGVFSRRKKPDAALHDGDRGEIYRALTIDPMLRRRKIVNQSRDPKKWRRERL